MDYISPTLLLIALIIFVYRVLSTRDTKELGLLFIFLLGAFLLFSYVYHVVNYDPLLCGVIIFNAMLASYGRKWGFIFLLAGIFYIYATLGTSAPLVLQAAVIGSLSTTTLYAKPKEIKKPRMHIERSRNIFQIVSGVFLILLFFFVRTAISENLLLSLFVVGIAVLDYSINNPNSLLPRLLSRMERQGFYMGYGAIWLGLGALVAAAFLGSTFALPVFASIFIGDSFSTLVGVRYGSVKHTYNKKKSVAGSIAYFLPVLLISFFVPGIGYWAFPLAAIGAFVESLPLPLDDNFSVSLVLTAAITLIP